MISSEQSSWELKLGRDQGFIDAHPDVVERQAVLMTERMNEIFREGVARVRDVYTLVCRCVRHVIRRRALNVAD